MNKEQEIKKLEIEALETKIQGMIAERQYISNKIEEAQSELKTLKTGSEKFYYVNIFGEIANIEPDNYNEDIIKQMQQQGNAFKTRDDAEKESDRRALLHEFNQFKNERNDGWTPNWKDFNMSKYFVAADSDGYLKSVSMYGTDSFVQFGYFHNYKDCMDAIEKFGDRIKKLYID